MIASKISINLSCLINPDHEDTSARINCLTLPSREFHCKTCFLNSKGKELSPPKIIPKCTNDQIIQINITKHGEIENVFNNFEEIVQKYRLFNIENIQRCLNAEISTNSYSWFYGKILIK